MLVGITQIPILVSLALIKRNLYGSHHFMLTIFCDLGKRRERTLLYFPGIDKTTKQLPLIPTDTFYHRQFAQTFHLPILIDVGLDILYLLGRKEGKLFQIFLGSGIEIDRIFSISLQNIFIAFPIHILIFLLFTELFEVFLPRLGITYLDTIHQKQYH